VAESKAVVAPKTRWVEMTPPWASNLLQNSNHDNRKIRESKVNRYAGDMKRGQWRDTGESIKIAGTGRLIDGQHRLAACVVAQKPFRTLLVEGLSEESILHVDTGLPRNRGDVLRFRGHEQWTNEVAQVARLLIGLEKGVNIGNHQAVAELGDELLIHVAEKWYDELVYCIRKGSALQNRVGLSKRLWAGLIFEMRQCDEEMASEFFDKLNTGTNLDPGSPILALREWAAKQARNARERRAPLSDKQYFTAFHLAWNAWIENKSMSVIRHYVRDMPGLLELNWKEVRLTQKR
jgi:hypothetical protein